MGTKIIGYKELLKTLVEYQITLIERLAHEGYDKLFCILLIPYKKKNEEELREIVLPLLRKSDRLFYIEGKIIALLPNTDWVGAMKVRDTILSALGLVNDENECIVEYPTDGKDAFALIGNLYARCNDEED